jgi:hypothetical protein
MMLKSAIKRAIKGVTFENAHSVAALEGHLPGAALALVNRVLDGKFASDDGIGLIREFATHEAGTPLMLVSNFAESQIEAEAAGAAPGFGKSDLYAEEKKIRLNAAVAMAQHRS